MIDNDWDADSLEYVVTLNSHVTPTEHLISLNPSAIWVSTVNQEISRSVKCLVIQAYVGKTNRSFNLSNLSFLNSLIIGHDAFTECRRIVLESMNGWKNDEWDLPQLQSITLGRGAFNGDISTVKSNTLIMNDWLIRSSFSDYIQRRWLQFLLYRQSAIGEWWLIIVFELDIPLLTQEGIQMKDAFRRMRKLNSLSMISWLIMIEMLIHLINSYDWGARVTVVTYIDHSIC